MAHVVVLEGKTTTPIVEFVACLVSRLLEAHLFYHYYTHRDCIPAAFKDGLLFLEMIERDTDVPVRRTMPLTAAEIPRLHREVATNGLDGSIFENPVIAPGFSITPYITYIPTDHLVVHMTSTTWRPLSLDVLGVPDIPWKAIGYIAYFSSSETFRKDVLQRLAGRNGLAYRGSMLSLEEDVGNMSLLSPAADEIMTSQAQRMRDASIIESLYIN